MGEAGSRSYVLRAAKVARWSMRGGWAPDGTIRRRAQSGERLSPLRGLRRRSPRRLKRRSLR